MSLSDQKMVNETVVVCTNVIVMGVLLNTPTLNLNTLKKSLIGMFNCFVVLLKIHHCMLNGTPQLWVVHCINAFLKESYRIEPFSIILSYFVCAHVKIWDSRWLITYLTFMTLYVILLLMNVISSLGIHSFGSIFPLT